MARQRTVSNLLALAVLSYLARGPMHPYQISRTLRDHNDDRSIRFNQGSLYTVVRQLARAGYIVETETVREGKRPERTVYALTDEGRREAHDWLRELVAEPELEYPHVVAALSLIAAIPPREAVALLRERLRRLAERRARTRDLIDRTLEEGVHPLFLVEEDYRLAIDDAETAFIERLIHQIVDPETGWSREWGAFHGDDAADATQIEERTTQ